MAERGAKEQATGKKLRGCKPKPPGEKTPSQGKTPMANTTDPESRMMPTRNGWVQGYNAQSAATEERSSSPLKSPKTPEMSPNSSR